MSIATKTKTKTKTKTVMEPSVRFVRTVSFSSAHRYFNPSLSEAENKRLYGSLYREHGFGHNFLLEAHFQGRVDGLTGMIINLVEIDQWLGEVTASLDHTSLNQLPVFQGVSPTPERVALYCFDELHKKLQGHPSGARLVRVRVYEGEALWVDCEGAPERVR